MTELGSTEAGPVQLGGAPTSSRGPVSAAYTRGYLRASWAVALLGAVAALLGRAVAPAVVGVWVGVDRIVTLVQFGAALAAQLFAILAIGLTMGLIIAVSRSLWPVGYRAFAVGAVGLVTMAVASAMFIALPEISGVVAGAVAAMLALLVARYGAAARDTRAVSLVLAGVGVGALLRVLAIGFAHLAREYGSVVYEQVAAVVATFGLVAHAVVLVIAFGWIAWRRGTLWSWCGSVALVALAVAAGWLAAVGVQPDASGAAVLARRALTQLVHAPAPLWVPPAALAFLQVLTWLMALAVLARRQGALMVPSAICLALIAAGAPEAPLCALALALAALLVSVGPVPEHQAAAGAS